MTDQNDSLPVPELPDQLLPAGEAQDPDLVVLVLCTHERPNPQLPCADCGAKLGIV
jgi:hypothetical protein